MKIGIGNSVAGAGGGERLGPPIIADPAFESWIDTTSLNNWSVSTTSFPDYYIVKEGLTDDMRFVSTGNTLHISAPPSKGNGTLVELKTYKYRIVISEITSGQFSFRADSGSGQYLKTGVAGEHVGYFTPTVAGVPSVWRDSVSGTNGLLSYIQIWEVL